MIRFERDHTIRDSRSKGAPILYRVQDIIDIGQKMPILPSRVYLTPPPTGPLKIL